MLLVVIVAVVCLDQWSKSWAERALANGPRHVFGPVELVLTYNRGAAFSLGSQAAPAVEVLAVVLAALVLWQSGRLAVARAGWALVIGSGLLSGGALSNLADRALGAHRGAVVDFIQVATWWPVFNVADIAITLGALSVVVGAVLSGHGAAKRRRRGSRGEGVAPVRPEEGQRV